MSKHGWTIGGILLGLFVFFGLLLLLKTRKKRYKENVVFRLPGHATGTNMDLKQQSIGTSSGTSLGTSVGTSTDTSAI